MILPSLRLSRSTTLTMLGTVAVVVFLTWVITQSQVSARYPDAPLSVSTQPYWERPLRFRIVYPMVKTKLSK